ncbi:MAG: hypothetical protein KGJ09_09860 [Candidatus Omnitrophica bacterium]|nr:hypothetical protein [Candidatus Omnitrophota bacterium]MDE2215293.1 hypothetical protein [Candidatus Omnitrophota bacterium]MDE2232337.1 hypothetical protein [Candidatus Omnitrophota bacterium]
MISYEQEFFKKFKFAPSQIERYVQSADRDYGIAQKDQYLDVKFTYCYQALIKIGIAVLAKKAGVKVRSVMGHHVKILEKLSEILNDEDIFTIGNAMRMKRNKGLYDPGVDVTKKETHDYIVFVDQVIQKAKKVIG